MANVAKIDNARAEPFATDLLDGFVAYGALVARAQEVGDTELWRATARRVAHEHGNYVATGYHGPANEMVGQAV